MRILEPVRLAGRPIMYTTLGISLYQCMVAPMLSK